VDISPVDRRDECIVEGVDALVSDIIGPVFYLLDPIDPERQLIGIGGEIVEFTARLHREQTVLLKEPEEAGFAWQKVLEHISSGSKILSQAILVLIDCD
jgi:hypothetical protein